VKLRIRDNSVRLRLTKSEVKHLCDTRLIESAVGFPGGRRLRYAVDTSAAGDAVTASYRDDTLLVSLPAKMVADWEKSEEITLSGAVDIGGDTLSILVEKDFACLSPREGEDESDMFANPQQGKVSC
jgi:hypothetical protein